MSLTNQDIAQIFSNIADLLEIRGESRFRFLSYRRAGEVLGDLPRPLQAYMDDNTLEDLPGVGSAIGDKIRELLSTGQLQYYERLKQEVPLSLLDIMRINGVGPKKAKLFWDDLSITTLDQLKEVAQAGKLRDLPKMGEKSEQKILEGIEALSRYQGRIPIGRARPEAERILKALLALPQVQAGTIAGSIRRARTTIGDVDILIASDEPTPIMETFVNLDGIARILGHGEKKSSIELNSGLQVDVRVLPRKRWGTALQYFTGSKDHNVRIREIAREQGYSLNEEALSPIDAQGNITDAKKRYFEDEVALYEALGLPFIPPEMREDLGEIEAAQAGRLPTLIMVENIIADLHMHTTESDGTNSLEEMAEAAFQLGYTHICITDHSQRSVQANGLNADRLRRQREQIDALNTRYGERFHILHGVEMDILEDGALDLPDDVLSQLDLVVASLHFGLNQDEATITRRLLNAINNPHVDIIGHPTARLIHQREPAAIDLDAVFEAARATDTALEINANPQRLDLDSQYVRRAVELGVKLSINTDAHSLRQLDLIDYGVNNARRGWAKASDVLNTWSYDHLVQWLHNRA